MTRTQLLMTALFLSLWQAPFTHAQHGDPQEEISTEEASRRVGHAAASAVHSACRSQAAAVVAMRSLMANVVPCPSTFFISSVEAPDVTADVVYEVEEEPVQTEQVMMHLSGVKSGPVCELGTPGGEMVHEPAREAFSMASELTCEEQRRAGNRDNFCACINEKSQSNSDLYPPMSEEDGNTFSNILTDLSLANRWKVFRDEFATFSSQVAWLKGSHLAESEEVKSLNSCAPDQLSELFAAEEVCTSDALHRLGRVSKQADATCLQADEMLHLPHCDSQYQFFSGSASEVIAFAENEAKDSYVMQMTSLVGESHGDEHAYSEMTGANHHGYDADLLGFISQKLSEYRANNHQPVSVPALNRENLTQDGNPGRMFVGHPVLGQFFKQAGASQGYQFDGAKFTEFLENLMGQAGLSEASAFNGDNVKAALDALVLEKARELSSSCRTVQTKAVSRMCKLAKAEHIPVYFGLGPHYFNHMEIKRLSEVVATMNPPLDSATARLRFDQINCYVVSDVAEGLSNGEAAEAFGLPTFMRVGELASNNEWIRELFPEGLAAANQSSGYNQPKTSGNVITQSDMVKIVHRTERDAEADLKRNFANSATGVAAYGGGEEINGQKQDSYNYEDLLGRDGYNQEDAGSIRTANGGVDSALSGYIPGLGGTNATTNSDIAGEDDGLSGEDARDGDSSGNRSVSERERELEKIIADLTEKLEGQEERLETMIKQEEDRQNSTAGPDENGNGSRVDPSQVAEVDALREEIASLRERLTSARREQTEIRRSSTPSTNSGAVATNTPSVDAPAAPVDAAAAPSGGSLGGGVSSGSSSSAAASTGDNARRAIPQLRLQGTSFELEGKVVVENSEFQQVLSDPNRLQELISKATDGVVYVHRGGNQYDKYLLVSEEGKVTFKLDESEQVQEERAEAVRYVRSPASDLPNAGERGMTRLYSVEFLDQALNEGTGNSDE